MDLAQAEGTDSEVNPASRSAPSSNMHELNGSEMPAHVTPFNGGDKGKAPAESSSTLGSNNMSLFARVQENWRKQWNNMLFNYEEAYN